MRYFDTLKLKYVDTILNQNFIRDIKFFKDTMLEIKSETKNNFGCFQNKAIVMSEFIFEYTSSAIYITDLQYVLVENYYGLSTLRIKS